MATVRRGDPRFTGESLDRLLTSYGDDEIEPAMDDGLSVLHTLFGAQLAASADEQLWDGEHEASPADDSDAAGTVPPFGVDFTDVDPG